MADIPMSPMVVDFFMKAPKWGAELIRMRGILLGCGLEEELKWGKPCYTSEGKNIAILQPFKDYCALAFFRGALLKDPEGILVAPTQNVQEARQARFTSVAQIDAAASVLAAYTREAIENERAGLVVELKKVEDYPVPAELQERLDADAVFRDAFEALTPGRRKGYLYYVSQAKQSKTRAARVEKSVGRILEGKGFDE